MSADLPRVEAENTPRVTAFVLAQAVLPSLSGGLNIIECTNGIGTWVFPNHIPPYFALAILEHGAPGASYETYLEIVSPAGIVLGGRRQSDANFPKPVRRVHLIVGLQEIASGPLIEAPGIYLVRLHVNGRWLADTELEVQRVSPPQEPALR
jgi:hypothetical protein